MNATDKEKRSLVFIAFSKKKKEKKDCQLPTYPMHNSKKKKAKKLTPFNK